MRCKGDRIPVEEKVTAPNHRESLIRCRLAGSTQFGRLRSIEVLFVANLVSRDQSLNLL